MNGVTGRMGTNQHLVRSILAIRAQGGLQLGNGDVIWPNPLLVGRSEPKLAALASAYGLERWTTSLEDALANPDYSIYFDAQATRARTSAVRAALDAGKHIYCEKPLTSDVGSAIYLARLAKKAGIKTGVVQDKLFLPGLLKLKHLVDTGFFGRVLSVRGDFGYWVFEGPEPAPQRPSWNYRAEDGGGIIIDMFSHWRYVIDHIFGPVRSVFALGATHIPERVDEEGRVYRCTGEDAAYAVFEVEGGIVAQFNSSWCTRVRRDELLELHVDGTGGSAVAGLHKCWVQDRARTPKAVWNPDLPFIHPYCDDWSEIPDSVSYDNGFKMQWELFLRHVVCDECFPWDFLAGAKGIQLAELAMQSWRDRRLVDVAELTL